MEARTRWTDQRLDEFAESLRPLPVEVGKLREAVDHLTGDMNVVKQDLSAIQRQIAQIGWGVAAALLTGLVAVAIALV